MPATGSPSTPRTPTSRVLAAGLSAFVLLGPLPLAASAEAGTGIVRTVAPGQSLATALRASAAGDVVELQNGSYSAQSLSSLALPGITLRGQSRSGVVVRGLALRGVSGLTVSSMSVVNDAGSSQSAIRVSDGSHDLSFRDLTVAPKANSAFDVWAKTTRVSLSDSTLTGPGGPIDVSADATSRGVRINGAPYDVASWPTDITLSRNEISGFGSDLIQIAGGQRITIDHNYLHDPKADAEHNDGVQTYGSNDLRIEGNRFRATGPNGPDQAVMLNAHPSIASLRVNRTTLVNNVVESWHGSGFNVSTTTDTVVANNTVGRTGTSTSPGSSIALNGTHTGVRIFNNVLDKVYGSTSGVSQYSNNCIRSGGGGTALVTADPQFVDAALRIGATSPCRNRGTATGAPTTDIAGTPRDATPDLGAYEIAPVVDLTAPSVPGPVVARADSASQVSLSWSASSDAVGVASYRITRNGTIIADKLTGTTFLDSTASAATTYSYTVSAVDTAGNRSAESTPATVSTPTPPAPTGQVRIQTISGGTTSSNTASWSHTTSTGADLLLVSVAFNDSARTVTAVSYAGRPLTRVPGSLARSGTTGTDRHVETWSLSAPPAGTASVTTTVSGTTGVSMTGQSATFTGVDTTSPLGTATATGGTAANPTVTVPSTPGALVFTGVSTRAAAPGAPTGALKSYTNLSGTNAYSGSAALPTTSTTSSTPATWTAPSGTYAITAVPVNAAR